MNNPYFNKNHPKTWKEKLADFFYYIAIPFIWLGAWVFKMIDDFFFSKSTFSEYKRFYIIEAAFLMIAFISIFLLIIGIWK
jgi:phospholipase C